MGNTKSANGSLTMNDDATNDGGPVADFQAIADRVEQIGGVLKLPSAEREQLVASSTKVGWLLVETDTSRIFLRTPDRPQGLLIIEDTGWIDLTLASNWKNWGEAYELARVRRVSRVVHVTGLIRDGEPGVGTLLTTLPVGFRPGKVQQKVVWANGQARQVDIYPDGRILVGDTPVSSFRTTLDLSFVAEQ
ncbi:hypothetical protein [Microbacterium plantarum]|uniref:hypothetical protein n=1 Tax=Microbacterium plantarum TaxID=1816425 RepID=UPI002B4A3AE3|nr:hypothetical protein [Microbacterium plantarum]WRK16110.1 hypothetical protein VC184_09270 [Microbacterium plantarum]